DGGANVFGDGVEVGNQLFGALLGELRVLVDRPVQVGDVGAMVAIVVDAHGLFVDVRLEGVVVVRERWQLVGHVGLPSTRRMCRRTADDAARRTGPGRAPGEAIDRRSSTRECRPVGAGRRRVYAGSTSHCTDTARGLQVFSAHPTRVSLATTRRKIV